MDERTSFYPVQTVVDDLEHSNRQTVSKEEFS